MSSKDIAYIALTSLALLVLFWVFISDRLFPKMKRATRLILVGGLYLSTLFLHVLLGN